MTALNSHETETAIPATIQPQVETDATIPAQTHNDTAPSGWEEVVLPHTLTISEMAEWYPNLQNQLGKRIQLNGNAIQRVDTAALQVLLAFMHSPEVTVGWVHPSLTLCEAAHWLGLTAELGLPPYPAS